MSVISSDACARTHTYTHTHTHTHTHTQDTHPEDGMIAQYIQALEQQKAAHTQFAYPSDYYNVIPTPYAAVQHAPHAVRQYVFRPY